LPGSPMASFSVVFFTAAPHAAADGGGAFIKIDGRESLLKAVELFLNRSNVKQLQLVVNPEQMEESKRKYGGHLSFSGVKLLAGGPKWIDQIHVAAEKVSPECSRVLVHDAARCAVPYTDIEAVMGEAEKHSVVVLASPARSSLIEMDESGEVMAMHSPQKFLNVTSPWAFERGKFLDMAKSRREPSPSEIFVLRGSPLNVRVNGSADAALIKSMIHLLPKPKVRAADNPFEEAQW
jgi:2-C-methyl-D-erythritol 4-phosphate cytidylyltransferase